MRVVSLVLSAVCLAGAPSATQFSATLGAPETFSAQAQVIGPLGAAAAPIKIVIQRYTPEAERTALEAALATGGYPAFLPALRRSSDVGYVEHGTARFTIRYARETKTDKGRRIDVVTDRPIFFVGGGAPERQAARELRRSRAPHGSRRHRVWQRRDGGRSASQAGARRRCADRRLRRAADQAGDRHAKAFVGTASRLSRSQITRTPPTAAFLTGGGTVPTPMSLSGPPFGSRVTEPRRRRWAMWSAPGLFFATVHRSVLAAGSAIPRGVTAAGVLVAPPGPESPSPKE